MEGKQQTPSVIARLMGLDELPPQPTLPSKQMRVFSENYLEKTASIGLRKKSSFSIGISPGLNPWECLVVRDEFEVEIPDCYSHEKSREGAPKLKMRKRGESRFTSMNERHSYFKEFYGHPGKPVVSKPFNEIGKRSTMSTAEENTFRTLPIFGIGKPGDNIGECDIHHSKKINHQFDSKANLPHSSTRIILLRPSSGKSHNSKNQPFSLRPGSASLKYKEFTRQENKMVDNKVEKSAKTFDRMESQAHGFRVPRTVTQTTNLLQNQVNRSSKYSSRAESMNMKAELLKLPSSNFFGKRREDNTDFFSKKSSFSEEAKKQIIERWKLTNDFQEVEVAHRSQSLGEMLSTDDLEKRPQLLGSEHDIDRVCSSSSVQNRISGSCIPLVVSSKDCWKDEYSSNSPIPSHSNGSRVASGHPEDRCGNKASLYDHVSQEVAVTVKMSNSGTQKDSSEYRNRISSVPDKSSDSGNPCPFSSNVPTVGTNDMALDETEATLENDVYNGGNHVCDVSGYSARGLAPTLETAGMENIRNFPLMFDDFQAEATFIKDGGTCGISVGQQSWTESSQSRIISAEQNKINPESPQNRKETHQYSPNSVLEPPFKEDKLSTSEFRDSHADLCRVAMQLQLIESNSEETYSEGSEMGVSSDEEFVGGSLDFLQGGENILTDFKTEEARDFSYLVNVLDEANLPSMDLGIGFEKCNSLEFPVSPSVFDLLEKKYGKQASWLKSERKLLFDHINSGLSEILLSFLDISMMEKSMRRRCCSTLRRNDVEDELWKMLVSWKAEVKKDLSGKVIGNETKWLRVEEEIGSICREIENFLFDELVEELV